MAASASASASSSASVWTYGEVWGGDRDKEGACTRREEGASAPVEERESEERERVRETWEERE